MSNKDVIVCDNGTGFVKCGFGGDYFPTAIIPALVGRPILRAEEQLSQISLKDVMIGDEASDNRNNLQMSYPMENGIIRNWDDMGLLWDYTFYQKLGIKDCRQHKIMLTEPVGNPIKNREQMCRVMFEKYGFSAVYISIQAVLTLYAQGWRFIKIRSPDWCCY